MASQDAPGLAAGTLKTLAFVPQVAIPVLKWRCRHRSSPDTGSWDEPAKGT
jgi:hypothetical protein